MTLFTAAQALEMAMDIEQNGEAFYREAAAKATDPEVTELFEDLALQEQAHYRIFQHMLEGEKAAPPQPTPYPTAYYDEYDAYIKVALNNALFAGPDKAVALARKAEDRETALRAAIGFEKDTLLFFYDLLDMVSQEEEEAISGIIREEQKHVRRLARMLQ